MTDQPQNSAPAGLRRSHFASGWDAARTRLEAEVQRLQGELERVTRENNVAVERMRIAEYRESELQKDVDHLAADLARVTAERDALREAKSLAANALECIRTGRYGMADVWLSKAYGFPPTRLDAAQPEAK